MVTDNEGHEHWHDDWYDFLDASRSAVAPNNIKGKPDQREKATEVLPPVVLLSDGGRQQAVRQLDTCVPRVDNRDPRTEPILPANTDPGENVSPLSCEINIPSLRQRVPRRTGRLKLTDFSLMRDVVEWTRQPAATQPPSSPDSATSLRNHCYNRAQGPGLRFLSWLGGTVEATGGFAKGWSMVAGPVCHQFPRWLWARGRTRRLMRSKRTGWYAALVNRGAPLASGDFFEDVHDRVTRLVRGNDRRSPERRERELEQMLLRALETDFQRLGRAGRISPWRRRRLTRFVFLIRMTGGEATRRGARFLEEYTKAAAATHCGAVLVAADAPVGITVEGREVTLSSAAARLRSRNSEGNSGVPLLVRLPGELPNSAPYQTRSVKHIRVSPATEMTAWCTALALAAGMVAWYIGPPPDTTCLTASATDQGLASSSDDVPKLNAAYKNAQELILTENDEADKAKKEGRTVRTVAYIGAGVTESGKDVARRSDGAVPELRGIALAQQHINHAAAGKIWLRVEVYDNAEKRYKKADSVAKKIIEDQKKYEIIGVVGFAQSRKATQEAVSTLTEASIPVITTTATADEMNPGRYFHAVAPPNSREAQIVGQFAQRANIVRKNMDHGEGAPEECAPAEAAVVVLDPEDVFSKSIGESLAKEFPTEAVHTVRHTPEEQSPEDADQSDSAAEHTVVKNIRAVANEVCTEVTNEPRTVVYWAARSFEFEAFLEEYGAVSECTDHSLTVVGSNELTNAVLSGSYDIRPWLRLYHTAHVLPVGHTALSDEANVFNEAYTDQFGDDDPWRHDGHAALAYDAMRVLAQAADKASEAQGNQLNARAVEQQLLSGIKRQGASGYLDMGKGFPNDKTVVVLHHTDKGSGPVLFCGRLKRGTDENIDGDCPSPSSAPGS
jgi:ABC-type branched-subunit amino acid transport system substrate-binding protein